MMRILRNSIDFFLNSSLYIGCCAVVFVLTGAYLLSGTFTSLQPLPLLAVGSATFIIYNLTLFLLEIRVPAVEQRKRHSWMQQWGKLMYPFLLLASLTLLVALIRLPYQELLFLLHLGIISVLYTVPDRYAKSRFRSLRSVPLFKIFLIAYVWAAMGSFYPQLLLNKPFWEAFSLFVAQFLFILAITLPFDIRDYRSDERKELLTIPGVLGIQRTRWLSAVVWCLYVGLMGIWCSSTVVPLLCLSLVALPLLLNASPEKPYWYYLGLIDGLILLQGLLLFALDR